MPGVTDSDHHWNYDNPSKWCEHFPDAGGSSQSPINIDFRSTVKRSFSPFEFSPDYNRQILLTLTNNGHSISATLNKATQHRFPIDLWVKGGGLPGTFHFVNFHLHWGKNDRCGSEHEVNGKSFAAEAHFVHKNYETGQIAVFASFLQVVHYQDEENRQWMKYSKAACKLKNVGETVECIFNLRKAMNIKSKEFFRYIGSLTTPPCSEGVIWTVLTDVTSILEKDLDLLRNNIMRKVYRPVQSLNHRVVYRN